MRRWSVVNPIFSMLRFERMATNCALLTLDFVRAVKF